MKKIICMFWVLGLMVFTSSCSTTGEFVLLDIDNRKPEIIRDGGIGVSPAFIIAAGEALKGYNGRISVCRLYWEDIRTNEYIVWRDCNTKLSETIPMADYDAE